MKDKNYGLERIINGVKSAAKVGIICGLGYLSGCFLYETNRIDEVQLDKQLKFD